MLEKVKEIIVEQLNLDDASVEITEETRFKEDLEADSLDLFEMVMQIEEEYGVEIPSADLEKLTTVGSIIDYLKAKGVEV
jgi:acyl carrier protein